MNTHILTQDSREQLLKNPILIPTYCFCCGNKLYKCTENTMACKKCGEIYDIKITKTNELSVKLISNWS